MFLSLFPLPSRSAEIPEKSREQINKIIKIIKRFQSEYDNLNDPAVKKTLMEEVAAFITLSPDTEIKTMDKDDLVNRIRRKVALRFPDKHAEFIAKVNAEVEEKFKMTKINEFTSVKYRKGNNIFTQEGVFYSYGIGNRSVRIGNSNISIIDLFDSDRIKFDESFNRQQQKEFVDSKVENYYKVKQAYFNEVHSDITKQINDQNENNGYIYVWNKWWTAKELTQKLIDDEMGGVKPPSENTEEEVTSAKQPVSVAAEPNVPPSETVQNQKTKDLIKKAEIVQNQKAKDLIKKTEDDQNQKIKDLIKKTEDEWIRIGNTFPGIDGDQGYKPALWYMKSNDVAILLAKELVEKQDDENIKTIKMDTPGPIECIELHFFHGYFYKVVTKYRMAKSTEAMIHIARKIKDKYGPTDQEKEAERISVKAEENTENPEETKPEEPKVKGEEPPAEEQPLPAEETFTWSGKYTNGTLHFRRNPDNSLAEMTFTKENPRVVEEITIKLEVEKKKKEKEDELRELELYKKQNLK